MNRHRLSGILRILAGAALLASGVLSAAPPTNDNFAAATVQSGHYWQTSGTLHEATSEANEPILSGYPNGMSAWWKWTAPAAGTYRLRTWGSEDHVISAVYRGSSLNELRLVAQGNSRTEREHSAQLTFQAAAGTTYHIQIVGTEYYGQPAFDDALRPSRVRVSLTPVSSDTGWIAPNDNFAAATPLSGSNVDVTACNSLAVSEPGEPLSIPGNSGNTIWFAWTAPSNGTFCADTQHADFDGILAVYTGSALNALTRLDYAVDTSGPLRGQAFGGGRVNFRATAGTTYRIQVQGQTVLGLAEHGVVRLLIQPVIPPANDDFANATSLTGTIPYGDGWTTFATAEAGEPAANPDETKSLWWTWTAPITGSLAVVQYGGTVQPFTGSSVSGLTPLPFDPRSGNRYTLGGVTYWYQVTAGTVVRLRGGDSYDRVRFSLRVVQSPAHDDFINRMTLSGTNTTHTTDLEYASWENAEPGTGLFGPQSVWYRWVAPSTGRYIINSAGSSDFHRLAVYTGTALNSITPAGEEQLGSNGTVYGRIILNAVSGTEYAIRLMRDGNYNGPAKVNIHAASAPPNDNIANATTMTGGAWSANGSNTDATLENSIFESPPTYSDMPSYATVWWRWTAPATGRYLVSTAGSAIDTALAVYTGSPGSLISVGTDTGSGWRGTGSLALNATVGTQYYIQVDGQSFQEGALRVSVAPYTAPPNNNFANRMVMSGASTQAGGTVTGATAEAGEPAVAGANSGRSVWYEWTAPANGRAIFRFTAARFSPAFGIYTGNSIGTLSPLASGGGNGSPSATEQEASVGYSVSAGTNYKILVDGNPSANGNITVSISLNTAPVNDTFTNRTIISGQSVRVSTDNLGATADSGEPAHAGSSASGSVWWQWTATTTGRVTLDTSGSAFQPRLAVYTGTAVNALSSVASATGGSPFTSLSFDATAGTNYLIAADNAERLRGLIVLNLATAAAAPLNDSFAAATIWNADQGETLAYPRGTGAEAGEPAHGGRAAARSLWWAWTPQTTRRARIWMATDGAGMLGRLAIYRGSVLNSLTPIAAMNLDAAQGRLEFDALAGETYRIVFDTTSLAADPGWVRVGAVPVNGNRDNAYIIPQNSGTFTVDTTGSYEEEVSDSPISRRRLWFAWTPAVAARMEWRAIAPAGAGIGISTSGGGIVQPVPGTGEVTTTFDVLPDITYFVSVHTLAPGPVQVELRESPAQAPPPNDRYYSATVMSGMTWSLPVTLGSETTNQLYWRWTAPVSGVAEIKLDGALADEDALLAYADGQGAITAGASRTNGGPPILRVASDAGQQWLIVSRSSLRRLRSATLSLASPAPGTPPANDDWRSSATLLPNFTNVSGDLTYASCQPGEPDHSASNGTGSATLFPPGRSVWYNWTPTTTGPATFLLQSQESLALRLYRGRSREQWIEDKYILPGQPSATLNVVAGETYHVAVATRPYHERTGAFTLILGAAAPNDMMANAVTLAGTNATHSVDSSGATIEYGEPGYGSNSNPSKASLWWKWTAPSSAAVWVDTLGSTYDTVLTAFSTDPPTLQSIVAENDNASSLRGAGCSAITFNPVSGQTYLIRVTRASNDTGYTGTARVNLSSSGPIFDPWARWLAANPTLTGPDALPGADPDRDGMPNILELATGGNPRQGTKSPLVWTTTPQGMEVEAMIDRSAISGLFGAASLDVYWEISYDLVKWHPGPPVTFAGTVGTLSREKILLQPNGPRFARLAVRRTR